jgi:hypothetical protein
MTFVIPPLPKNVTRENLRLYILRLERIETGLRQNQIDNFHKNEKRLIKRDQLAKSINIWSRDRRYLKLRSYRAVQAELTAYYEARVELQANREEIQKAILETKTRMQHLPVVEAKAKRMRKRPIYIPTIDEELFLDELDCLP